MYIGVSYYPEFENKEVWQSDIDQIAEMGFNVVRMAEFAWCRMEPREGAYDFTWLEEVIEGFGKKGIKTVLGTPTGAPPQWILNKYPDLSPMDKNGVRYHHVGGFGQYCKTHPGYREYSRKIVHEMATYFKGNPYVIMYQIDNEFMGQPCFCEHCAQAYIEWIKQEHETIEAYNTHLFTMFQGRELACFEEAKTPKNPNGAVNPGLLMDYKKFTSRMYIEYCKIQADAIREVAPEVAITSNFCTLFQGFDHFEMAELFDVGACDTYPKADNDESLRNALKLDLTRALKKENFWVLEQQCSPVAFREYNYSLEPLESRLYTYKSIAHGADGIVYFRWKATHSGGERFGAGILRHDGQKERTYYEVKRICDEVKQIEAYLDGSERKHAKVAMIYSNLSIWAVEEGRKINQDISYTAEMIKYYKYFQNESVALDFVHVGDDLSTYDVVIAPLMAVVTEKERQWIEAYVKQGGKAIFGMMSGMFDAYNQISSNYYQGVLRDLLGIRVLEWATPYKNENYTMSFNGVDYVANTMNMVLELEGAETVATYNHGFYKGTPAITVNVFGKGEAYYVGTSSDDIGLKSILDAVLGDRKENSQEVIACNNLDIQIRTKEGMTLYFIMNQKSTKGEVTFKMPFLNVLTKESMVGTFEVKPYDVLLVMKEG